MLEKETYSSKKVCETRSFLRTWSMLFCQSLRFFPTVWMFFAHSPKNLWIQNFYQKIYQMLKGWLWTSKKQFWRASRKNFDRIPENCNISIQSRIIFFLEMLPSMPKIHFWRTVEKFSSKVQVFLPRKKMKDTNKIPKHFSPKVSPGHVECSFDNSAETFFPKRPKGFSSKWKKFLKLNFSPKKQFFQK